MTTSAYNLGNSGLASKVLRTKDLMRVAVVGWVSVWLGVLLSMPQFGLLRFLSKGCTSHEWKIFWGWAVEKGWAARPHPSRTACGLRGGPTGFTSYRFKSTIGGNLISSWVSLGKDLTALWCALTISIGASSWSDA